MRSRFVTSVIILTLLVFVCIDVWAQEEYAPGEIVTMFDTPVLELPPGSELANIEQVTIHTASLRDFVDLFSVETAEKVFKGSIPNDTLKVSRTGDLVRVADLSRVYKFKLPVTVDIPFACSKLQELPEVIYAEPNYLRHACIVPNDSLFEDQWGLYQANDVDIDAPEAWELSTGSESHLLAILDTGIDYNHDDLGHAFGSYPNSKIVGGYDFVNNDNNPMDDNLDPPYHSHGTSVAGVAAALTNNYNEPPGFHGGVAGVSGGWRGVASPSIGSPLLAVKVLCDTGTGTITDVSDGILWAVDNGAWVINMSLGWYGFSFTECFAVTEAWWRGTIIVASMGNHGRGDFHAPSGYSHACISVGAVDKDGNRITDPPYEWESNYGPWIDVMAPGINCSTTARLSMGSYQSFSGTSCSAPFVSGLCGLLLQHMSAPTPEKLEAFVRASGKDYPSGYWDEYKGYGLINARQGLDLYLDPHA